VSAEVTPVWLTDSSGLPIWLVIVVYQVPPWS
jgi:hypothetical protein